jgi:hypothetical protein
VRGQGECNVGARRRACAVQIWTGGEPSGSGGHI